MDEVFIVEPNNLGNPFMTKIYRRYNVYFKQMPFLIVVPLSFIAALLLYFLFGYVTVTIVNILQYGF
jgi:hypothetical protein